MRHVLGYNSRIFPQRVQASHVISAVHVDMAEYVCGGLHYMCDFHVKIDNVP